MTTLVDNCVGCSRSTELDLHCMFDVLMLVASSRHALDEDTLDVAASCMCMWSTLWPQESFKRGGACCLCATVVCWFSGLCCRGGAETTTCILGFPGCLVSSGVRTQQPLPTFHVVSWPACLFVVTMVEHTVAGMQGRALQADPVTIAAACESCSCTAM